MWSPAIEVYCTVQSSKLLNVLWCVIICALWTATKYFLCILNWLSPTLEHINTMINRCWLYFMATTGTATSSHPDCQIFFLPPLPPYMKHYCRPVGQSQADTDRLQLKNRSTRETAHFWKPVTHDTFLENTHTPSFCHWTSYIVTELFFFSEDLHDFSEVVLSLNYI